MDKQRTNETEGQLTRRAFLRGLAAAGGVALLAACGGTAPAVPAAEGATAAPAEGAATATTSVPPTAAPTVEALATAAPTVAVTQAAGATQPTQGGVYRLLSRNDVPSMDAALAFDYTDWWASSFLLYNRLYFFDPNIKIFPDLAAELPQVSDDKLRYTIPLRKGVKFHNGREMTADDVKFSLERQLDVKLASPGAKYLANIVGATDVTAGKTTDLTGVKVLDPYTVEITLAQPQAVFTAILGISTNGIVPKDEVQKAGADWGTKTAVGTGPFKLSQWNTGEKLVFERFPDYHKTGAVLLDGVEIQVNVDEAAGVLRWENGEAEYVHAFPPAEFARIQADAELSKRIRTSSTLIFIYLELRNAKPFDDVRVRQAVAAAIDKKTIAERVRNATPTDSIYQTRLPQYDAAFKSKFPYDPATAKKLLADAGHADGLTGLKMWSFNPVIAELVQADLKEAGIELEIITGDYALIKPRMDAGEIQMATRGDGADYPDADSHIQDREVCPATPPPAATLYCPPKVRELSDETQKLDPNAPARTDLFRQMQAIIVNDDIGVIPLYEVQGAGLGQTYVQGDILHPMFGLPVIEGVSIQKS